MSVAAYKKTMIDTSSPREMEKKILSQVTGGLERVSIEFDSSDGNKAALTQEVKDAVWANQKFWMALKADLMIQTNELPEKLRADLISLAIWIDKQSWEVMRSNAKIEPLIDVNKKIIAGLSGKRPA